MLIEHHVLPADRGGGPLKFSRTLREAGFFGNDGFEDEPRHPSLLMALLCLLGALLFLVMVTAVCWGLTVLLFSLEPEPSREIEVDRCCGQAGSYEELKR